MERYTHTSVYVCYNDVCVCLLCWQCWRGVTVSQKVFVCNSRNLSVCLLVSDHLSLSLLSLFKCLSAGRSSLLAGVCVFLLVVLKTCVCLFVCRAWTGGNHLRSLPDPRSCVSCVCSVWFLFFLYTNISSLVITEIWPTVLMLKTWACGSLRTLLNRGSGS